MKAIEFFTTAKNGKSIEIPKEYTKQISGEIHVIILLNKKTATSPSFAPSSAQGSRGHSKATKGRPKPSAKKAFKALKLKTKGFKFNREDIYNDE